MISDSLTWLQDLVYTEATEGRNWWSVVLSLLVISLVIAGILAAINTMGYVDELLYWSGRRMTLDEYLQVRNISSYYVLKKESTLKKVLSGNNFLRTQFYYYCDDDNCLEFSSLTNFYNKINHILNLISSSDIFHGIILLTLFIKHNNNGSSR